MLISLCPPSFYYQDYTSVIEVHTVPQGWRNASKMPSNNSLHIVTKLLFIKHSLMKLELNKPHQQHSFSCFQIKSAFSKLIHFSSGFHIHALSIRSICGNISTVISFETLYSALSWHLSICSIVMITLKIFSWDGASSFYYDHD